VAPLAPRDTNLFENIAEIYRGKRDFDRSSCVGASPSWIRTTAGTGSRWRSTCCSRPSLPPLASSRLRCGRSAARAFRLRWIPTFRRTSWVRSPSSA
jgi:hypothetical protein